MRMIQGILLGLCLCLAACHGASGPSTLPQPSASCTELDSLFHTLDALDSVLLNDAPWQECLPYLDASLPALTRNQRPDNKDCNYLDQQYKPDILRLGFVESLRSRIEADTLAEGIYYMLRWMGIFKGDPEISEFFSEEMSYLAMENPHCYLGYLQHNPDQEVMLLHSTKWNAPDLDSLLQRFSRLPGSETVTTFLNNLKDQKTDGI